MPNVLDPEVALDLVKHAVTALAGDEASKKVSPSVEAAFELARQTTIAGSRGKHQTVITLVKVSVHGGADSDGGQPVTAVFDKRQPTDSGPKPRVPIRTGGGTCISVTIGQTTVTVCIEWESAA
jgi:hypothetical protein